MQSITEYYIALQSITEYYRGLQSITEYYRVLQSITEYYKVLQSITETNLAHLLGPIFGLVFYSISPQDSQHMFAGDIEPEEGPRAAGEEEQGVEGEDQGQAGGDPWTW